MSAVAASVGIGWLPGSYHRANGVFASTCTKHTADAEAHASPFHVAPSLGLTMDITGGSSKQLRIFVLATQTIFEITCAHSSERPNHKAIMQNRKYTHGVQVSTHAII